MRHLINFFITGFVMLVFQWIGWIRIVADVAPFTSPFANQLVVAGIVGLIFTVGMWLPILYSGLWWWGPVGWDAFSCRSTTSCLGLPASGW